ncbi:MAG: ATP-binding cassette domain-containing protein [Blastocatellia bacterium]|nr:ATP-binding cassette domain-containing protein [Blastocatellia bacterium]
MSLPIASEERARAAESLIRLEEVSVEYRSPREQIRTFKEFAIRFLQGRVKYDQFRALDRISFDVRRGEVFGVIGKNGAGKSTLLKVVSRVIKPSGGRIVVRGRVAPLLELGAGFHPELSGRENVFLNGTLLGYTKAELEGLFDRIVDFADMWDFIDAPMRTYSTGMTVRLGFAVATATQPDLLLIDEVLSVGDEQFKEKCAARMKEFTENGTTILLVTHDTGLVTRICHRAVCLNHGRVEALGPVEEVIDAYRSLNQYDPQQKRARSDSTPRRQDVEAGKKAPPPPDPAEERNRLATLARQRHWRSPFELPGGERLDGAATPAELALQQARWRMIRDALAASPALPRPENASCLELGCAQGYFTLNLARAGYHKVFGVDTPVSDIEDADLLRRLYDLPNLQFHHVDFAKLDAGSFGTFDIVLMLHALERAENPIRTLRAVKAYAKRLVLLEAWVTPERDGAPSSEEEKSRGAFTLLDFSSPETPAPVLALRPTLRMLLWIMDRIGYTRVEQIPPPPEAREAYEAGGRVMLAGYVQ